MHILIEVLRVIIPLIIILLLVAALTGKKLIIQKSVFIQKPKNEVFEYLKLLKNHEHFSVWIMMDPDMKKEFRGTDGEIGFVYSWDSQVKNVGAGEQEIIGISENEEINYELRFFRPRPDVSYSNIQTESGAAGNTKVTWVFDGQMKFPSNLIKPLIKNMLGKQIETGLSNLKAVLEK